jgi:uncharacterized protein (TIGR02001 family)
MKKSFIALALVGAFAVPAVAEEAPASVHTLTGNVGLFSSYRFRGLDQTFGKPALQGGVDYSHASGLYAGNWNSNVSEYAGYPGGNLEMDLYGGYKASFGDFGVDVGGLYYYYPGSKFNGEVVDNFEVYLGMSWKFISFKWSHALTKYFDAEGTRGTNYFDLSSSYDLGDGWGINGHVGYTNVPNSDHAADYTDWKIGVTKAIGSYTVGLSYVDADANAVWINTGNGKTIDADKATLVLSVGTTF